METTRRILHIHYTRSRDRLLFAARAWKIGYLFSPWRLFETKIDVNYYYRRYRSRVLPGKFSKDSFTVEAGNGRWKKYKTKSIRCAFALDRTRSRLSPKPSYIYANPRSVTISVCVMRFSDGGKLLRSSFPLARIVRRCGKRNALGIAAHNTIHRHARVRSRGGHF